MLDLQLNATGALRANDSLNFKHKYTYSVKRNPSQRAGKKRGLVLDLKLNREGSSNGL
jgi:hypothetical protein